jgi:hypothetical protein
MTRAELHELGFIVPIATVPSILQLGVLSNRRASKVAHTSIASNEVQERRAKVVVPGGRRLHEYANLYICPRNPMLYVKKSQHETLCVLRVSPDVLDIAGAVVTDMNAGSDYVRFAAAPDGLEIVDRSVTFMRYWGHDDYATHLRQKSQKCAEVLVPDVVPVKFVVGAYVSGEVGRQALHGVAAKLTSVVNSDLFFV